MTSEAYEAHPVTAELTTIRSIAGSDRQSLAEIVRAAGNFNREEIATAIELIDEAIASGNLGDYIIYVLEDRFGTHGFVCLGPTPLTNGVYDLYWIAIDSTKRAKGYGRRLLRFVEDEVRRRGGRMIVIETSSLPSYEASRSLYARAGYDEAAHIRNFYNVGDDKLIYAKTI